MAWQDELGNLLLGHLGDVSFDEGITDMAAAAACDDEYRSQIVEMLDFAIRAAKSGDREVLRVAQQGNFAVNDLRSAIAILESIRSAFLERVVMDKQPARGPVE